MEKNQKKSTADIKMYFEGYKEQIKNLMNCTESASKAKTIVKTIAEYYVNAFALDYYRVFLIISRKNYLALMCLLMNPVTRKYLIKDKALERMKSDKLGVNSLISNIFNEYHIEAGNSDSNKNVDVFNKLYSSVYNSIDEKIVMNIHILASDSRDSQFGKLKEQLGNDLFSYKNEYGSAWKNLVPKGQKVMVIYCGYATKYHAVGDNVRNFDKNKFETK